MSLRALTYSHSPPFIFLVLDLSWWVLSESCQGICVCPPSSPHYSPWGEGACASLTSKNLPQRCSDVLCCLLKNLFGDCRHRGQCPIIPRVLLPVMIDHSLDAGLQSAALRARRGRGRGWRGYGWLPGKEQWSWFICINTTLFFVSCGMNTHTHAHTPKWSSKII